VLARTPWKKAVQKEAEAPATTWPKLDNNLAKAQQQPG
jgi:hypothetical protein